MATDEIKLDYPKAEEMAKTFQTGAEQLQDTAQEMQTIATTLEEVALLGRGGSAFVEAIRGKLCPSLARLTEKFREMDGDVQAAIAAMKQADEESKQQFA